MLTLAAAQLCGYQGLGHIRLATAVEFIHTATLLHDDVIDESDLRRGKAAAHVIWGNAPSVLVGDFLFSRSFQLMVETGSLRVLNILSNASAVIAEGEVMQLSTMRNLGVTEDTYLKIVSAKTAALFAAAAESGAVVAQADGLREMALQDVRPQSRHRVPARRRRARLFGARGDDGQGGRRRLPRRQADAAGDHRARQRECGGSGFLAAHDGAAHIRKSTTSRTPFI